MEALNEREDAFTEVIGQAAEVSWLCFHTRQWK